MQDTAPQPAAPPSMPPPLAMTIHFSGLTFKPLMDDLLAVNRLRATMAHEIGYTDHELIIAFADGTVLQFAGRVSANRDKFFCAPWFLGTDAATNRPKIYNANANQ